MLPKFLPADFVESKNQINFSDFKKIESFIQSKGDPVFELLMVEAKRVAENGGMFSINYCKKACWGYAFEIYYPNQKERPPKR